MSRIDGARILITGGSGSLGRALIKRLLSGENGTPKSITVFSRNEDKQNENKLMFSNPLIKYRLGDMIDKSAVQRVVEGHDIIIHAAAMKHVRNCTVQPELAWAINVSGTENLIEAVKDNQVDTVVNISSDKGVQPQNWYGYTKHVQEQKMLEANHIIPQTRFIAVCYGNVMASNGSVLQRWASEISNNKPINVNDPNMTRFLIALPQAVDTIMMALENAKRGEIYIPIIPSATMADLADVVIDGRNVEIKYPGKGDDEKMHETLVANDEVLRTIRNGNYYVVTRSIQEKPAINKAYISKDFLISKNELRELLDKYGLLIREKVLA